MRQTLVVELLITATGDGPAEQTTRAAVELVLGELVANGRRATRSQFIELWAKPSPDWLPDLVDAAGLAPYRGLHQMRRPLPADTAPAPTRAYRPGDAEELRLINNLAFADHPSQGAQTPQEWAQTTEAEWFRSDGTRILTEGNRIIGYCITKLHPDRGLGEIYVIGLDPSVHGRGLGASLTAAGLDWLHSQGMPTAMLYVEDNNQAAIRTYQHLGFTTVRRDRAWRSP